jgi:hypothetical protein
LEGRYEIGLRNPPSPNFYVADLRAGQASVLLDGAPAGPDFQQTVELLVKSDGATLTGTLTNRDGDPPPSAMVVLVPDRDRRSRPTFYRVTSSGTDGGFSLNGIAPGDYKVFAWQHVSPGAWENAEFLSPFEDRGRSVTFEPRSEIMIDAMPVLVEAR